MKHDFEERRQKRIDNAKSNAAKNEKLSDHYYVKANKMTSVIPMGQPILVGHYSEKSDRAYRGRIQATYSKSREAADKAEYYKEKAEAIESNDAIFSDDPQALDKLKSKLQALGQWQEFMKKANACIRKQDRETFLKLPMASPEAWEKINTPDFLGRTGFPSYKLSNNNANIARIKKRIAQLEKFASRPAAEVQFKGGRIVENPEAGRVQVIFDERPPKAICKMLGAEGFHWSGSQGAWQRHLNNAGIYAARQVLTKLREANL